MPRIFSAFEQGERSRTRFFGGLGLGLAISRAIVDLHDGSITAFSEGKDKGTKLFIRLHTVKPVESSDSPKPARPSHEPALERSLRVLLVEDHLDLHIAPRRLKAGIVPNDLANNVAIVV